MQKLGAASQKLVPPAGCQNTDPDGCFTKPGQARASSSAPTSAPVSARKPEVLIETSGIDWHYRYDRRLANFSKRVSCLQSSHSGAWLLGGSSSSDMRLWDSRSWGEAARLKGCQRQEPRCVAVSSCGKWLAAVQPGALSIFSAESPWSLVQALPPMMDPNTGQATEWCCAGFSPAPDENKACDLQCLVALSTTHIFVFDYAWGWSDQMSQRSHSLLRFAKPTSVAYSPCGDWVLCGNEEGQLQVWNMSALSLDSKLSAHIGALNCLTFSPRAAKYEPRAISCGVDRSLCVWRQAGGWAQELSIFDAHTGPDGIGCCDFSSSGHALLTVGKELCVWRVSCPTANGRLQFQIHQRLPPVGSCGGLSAAVFCGQDSIAAGSQDGSVSVWRCCAGYPPGPAPAEPEERDAKVQGAEPSSGSGSRAQSTGPGATTTVSAVEAALCAPRPKRPMRKISPSPEPSPGASPREVEDSKEEQKRRNSEVKAWSKKTMVRPITRSLPDLCAPVVEVISPSASSPHAPLPTQATSMAKGDLRSTAGCSALAPPLLSRSRSPGGRSLLASAGAGAISGGLLQVPALHMPSSSSCTFVPKSARLSEQGFNSAAKQTQPLKRASSARLRPPVPTVPVCGPSSGRHARDWDAVKLNSAGA